MLIVQKYGGSSVSDIDKIKKIAQKITNRINENNSICVVVSAMGDTTDELIDMSDQISENPPVRELDILLTAGERISMSLLAIAINQQGTFAKSFTGQQAGIETTEKYGKAHISAVVPERIKKTIERGEVAVIAGFQGIHKESNDVTTLGRGGSDTTAVALAAALNADVCEIYSDVDGVFTADPRICPKAKKLDFISYEEMLELAAGGAKILALRCVEYARRFNVVIHTRSSFNNKQGTIIANKNQKGEIMSKIDLESPIISGIAHDKSESMITLRGINDNPGIAAKIFGEVAKKGVNVDMIVQNISNESNEKTDISFSLPTEQTQKAQAALDLIKPQLGNPQIEINNNVGKLTLVGAGMKTNPGVSATFFEALHEAQINIKLISTSEIRISVIIDINQLETAVNKLHTAFKLDAETEAVVYAGTGR